MEEIVSLYNSIELLLFAVMLLSFIIIMIYWGGIFRRVTTHRHSKKIDRLGGEIPNEGVSIIVVIKDQMYYIENTLPLLLSQQYDGDYEVVVVNDSPEEEQTIDALADASKKYPHLYVTTIKTDFSFKHTHKLALTIGIKACKFNNIIITEPYAEPVSDMWLSYMSFGFTSPASIVAGYSIIERRNGGTNRLMRCHNAYSSLMSLGRAVKGKPYRAAPSNMGITADLFFRGKGYHRHLRLNSGENDLYIQRVNKMIDTSVIINPKAVTKIFTEGTTCNQWVNRLKFETYTHRYYPAGLRAYINSEPIFRFLFWGTLIAIAAMQIPYMMYVAAALAVIKWSITAHILKGISRRTGEKIPYMTYLFYYEFFSPIGDLFLSIGRRISPSKDLWI